MTADHWYRGYGLVFRSELDLPELTPIRAGTGQAAPQVAPQPAPDVTIRIGPDADDALARPVAEPRITMGFHATEAGHVLRIADIGNFLVRDGREIVFSPGGDAEPGLVRLFLIGSALGMLFHQRGQLVLHGAAILRPGGLSIFVGESGAGKSTLAANLGRSGHAVLADDTLPLYPTGDGGFQAWPGSRMFKLWRNSLEGMGEDIDALEIITNRQDKYYYRNPAEAPDRPEPLNEIIVLERAAEPGAPVNLSALRPIHALKAINEHAYRPEYVHHLGREAAHFHLTAALSGSARVLCLTRPWDLARMDDVIARLHRHWQGAPLDDPPGTSVAGTAETPPEKAPGAASGAKHAADRP